MRALAFVVVAAVVVSSGSAARPTLAFKPTTAAPGAALTVRPVVGIGDGRIAIRSEDGRRTTLRLAGLAGAVPLRVTVPNVPAGSYAVQQLRRGRVLATARRPLRVVESPPGVRDCQSSVYGEFAPGWERRTAWAGPLGLVGALPGVTPKPVRGAPGYFEPIKFVLVLENTQVATIRVSLADRRYVALLYATRGGLGQWRYARVADGLPAVRFEACGRSEVPHTQFNGGFVVAGPRCARLEVHVRGRAEPYELRVPFGHPCEP